MSKIDLAADHEKARVFTEGEVLFRQGDMGRTMYIVVEGQIELLIGDTVVERVIPGNFFGEMAIIDARPRSAMARAATHGRLLEIDEREFEKLITKTPFFALKVMRTLVARLRRANNS